MSSKSRTVFISRRPLISPGLIDQLGLPAQFDQSGQPLLRTLPLPELEVPPFGFLERPGAVELYLFAPFTAAFFQWT
jgi:hypothetical protein